MRKIATLTVAALAALAAHSASAQGFNSVEAAQNGWSFEQDRSAAWFLAQHNRLSTAINAIQPHKKGKVEAYVLSVSFDADAVFRREAGEAVNVLSRRYGAAGRTIFLAAGADAATTGAPQGSPQNVATALAAIASKMDIKEDVLILYVTTHGGPDVGLVYRDGKNGSGMIAPARLAKLLDDLGFQRRMILLSACYSGAFMPMLTNENSVIMTAASSRTTSFGCAPGNDWTFFGDALINHALRKPQSFEMAADEANTLISEWEGASRLTPSVPQVFVGESANNWLSVLEAAMPKTVSAPNGQPAMSTANDLAAERR